MVAVVAGSLAGNPLVWSHHRGAGHSIEIGLVPAPAQSGRRPQRPTKLQMVEVTPFSVTSPDITLPRRCIFGFLLRMDIFFHFVPVKTDGVLDSVLRDSYQVNRARRFPIPSAMI